MLYGRCFISKHPPIDFLKDWFQLHDPIIKDIPDKYVRFDLGGELGNSPEVVSLFRRKGYKVETTAPHSSVQNAPGERPHYSIALGIRTLLAGANLEPKFWPYAFHHYLRLYNVTPHHGRTKSPYEMCSGRLPDLSMMRTFGCHVTILPEVTEQKRRGKPRVQTNDGIFLGYTDTMTQIYYYDVDMGTIKTARHVQFDELMSRVPYE